MKNLLFLVLAMVFGATTMKAQSDETLFNRAGIRLTGAWGGTSLHFSDLQGEYAYFQGGFGGVEFNKKFFLGWGGLELRSDIRPEGTEGDLLEMDYNGLVLGYAPMAHKVFHPQVLLMGGRGDVEMNRTGRDRITFIQPALGFEVNVFRWFRVGVNGGYRFVSDVDTTGLSNSDLSSAFGEVKLKFGWSWGNE